jgi:hypothetical protein
MSQRRARRFPRLPLLLGLLGAAPAAAQTGTLPPGARVRVTAPTLGPQRAVFRLSAQRGDTLLLIRTRSRSAETVPLALQDVRELELSHGWRRRALVGGMVGLGVGVAAGAVIGYNSPVEPDPPECTLFCSEGLTRREGASLAAVSGAQVGAALGALVGRFVLGERWERIRISPSGLGARQGDASARVAVTIVR